MNGNIDSEVDELEQLRRENATLKWREQFFLAEHRFIGRFAGLILLGPRLTKSIHAWLLQATPSNPLPPKETSALVAAVVRRFIAVGLFGLLIPVAPLLWQNFLIRDQNRYFREQTEELRRQIAIQEEQGDFARRKDLLEAIYDGEGLSIRTRVEAVKALVRLDNKLLDQGSLAGDSVDLRGVDLGCSAAGSRECADFSGAWLVRTDFSGSNFTGADFKGADLRDSAFVSADLSGADFSFAFLEGAQFREVLFTPPFVSFRLSGHVPEPNLSATTLSELKRIVDSQGLTLEGKEGVIWAEFALERVSASDELSSSINRLTKAAVLYNTKLLASLEESWYLDQYTRLPLGVVDMKVKENRAKLAVAAQAAAAVQAKVSGAMNLFKTDVRNREKLVALDAIQARADEVFGLYKTNIHLKRHPPSYDEKITCIKSGNFIPSEYDLGSYAKLTPGDKESFIRELCGTEFKLRMRSTFPFPDSVR